MRKHLIPYALAATEDDAKFLAPTWTRAIIDTYDGWLCFEDEGEARDVWAGYEHL